MMQRDEETLLETWFKYYGNLFGFENLSVFDNRSLNPVVLEVLKRYEGMGSKIYRGFDTVEDFEGKGFHFTNVIQSWDHDLEYDFAIPLDCDEFLAVFTPTGISCDRTTIHKYLDGLIGTQQAIAIEWSLFNVPGKPGWFRPELYRKGFFARGTIKFLDHGFHEPRAMGAAGKRETQLAYVHLHNKSYRMTLDHAKRKLAHFVDVEDQAAIKTYVGPGSHLINHFLMTEAEYFAKYDKVLTVWFGEFLRLLESLDAPWPDLVSAVMKHPLEHAGATVVRLPIDPEDVGPAGDIAFRAEDYRAANSDIARSTSTPLMHYVRFGHGERRRLSLVSGDEPGRPGSRMDREGPVGLVVVLKDEVHDVAGWLAWHLAIGFDTIFVIDDDSTDGTDQVVKAAGGAFDVRYSKVVQDHPDFQERRRQEYRRAIKDLENGFAWLCFLDADEYLLLLEDPNVSSFLARFPDADGVALNWCLHGNNGHVLRPLVPAPVAYPKRSGPDREVNRHVKSILRPDRVGDRWVNVHCFDIRPDSYLDARGTAVRWSGTPGIVGGTPCLDIAHVMRFQSRSMEHFIDQVRKRSDIHVGGRSWSDGSWHDEEDGTPSTLLAPMFRILASIELATSGLLSTIMARHLHRSNSRGLVPDRSPDQSQPSILISCVETHHGTRLRLDPATNLIVHGANGPDGLLPLFLIRSPALPCDALLVAASRGDGPLRLVGGRQAATVIRVEVADAPGRRVTLRLPETSRFLAAEPVDPPDDARCITADRQDARDWEMFSLHAAAPGPDASIETLVEAYVSVVREGVTDKHLGRWLVLHDADTTSRLLQTVLRRMSTGEHLRLAARLAGVVPAELLSGSRYS